MGTIALSRSLFETTAKSKKIKATEYFHSGASFNMAFLIRFGWVFFNSHLKFISMPIKYIAIVLLGREPSNPKEPPGDS